MMPYVQLGYIDEEGHGLSITQAVVRAAYHPEPDVLLNGGRGSVFDNAPNTYWAPTVAWDVSRFSFWLSGALGRERLQAYDAATERYVDVGKRPIRVLMFGITAHKLTLQ